MALDDRQDPATVRGRPSGSPISWSARLPPTAAYPASVGLVLVLVLVLRRLPVESGHDADAGVADQLAAHDWVALASALPLLHPQGHVDQLVGLGRWHVQARNFRANALMPSRDQLSNARSS